MDGNLRGKVALVTGGARRIGAAICRELAVRGASVVVHYRHSEAEAIGLTRVLGSGVFSVRGDLADSEACRLVFQEAMEWMGRVDLLVNNAAQFVSDDAADLTLMRAVNLEAPLRLSRQLLEAGGKGAIIQMLDTRITRSESGAFSAYAATQRELADSVERLAREGAPRIRVNGVAPGPVLAPEGASEAAGTLPLGRRPTSEEIARAVAFLAESESVTGQILFVDGGQCLRKTMNDERGMRNDER